jgi:SAM-dependent methyltransferase
VSLSVPNRVSPDAFERWSALQQASTDSSNRLDESIDLAFWERVAANYDAGALPNRVPAVLDRVRELIPRGSSLLEIGAGTGAFTTPLADVASRVTAVDYSPAMMRVLDAKRRADPELRHVRTVLSRWEEADVEPHDVTFAANSLYRAHDLRCVLDRMLHATLRRGIVVWSVGRQDAPQQRVRDLVQPGRYRPGPDYVHLLDGLFALDVFAHVEIVEVDDTQRFDSDDAAIAALLSWDPVTPEERARARALLPAVLHPHARGWLWPRKGRIAIIWWDQPA